MEDPSCGAGPVRGDHRPGIYVHRKALELSGFYHYISDLRGVCVEPDEGGQEAGEDAAGDHTGGDHA